MVVDIIVPVYNVSKYLNKCIESLLAQTYKYIKIILVDDGSTDGSEKICDNYARIDDRINVIHKENGGLVSAWTKRADRIIGRYCCNPNEANR